MFKNLQEKINKAFYILKGDNKVTEINISIVLKDIGKALIDSDVNHEIVKNFIKKVRDKSIGKKIFSSLNPKQIIIKSVYDELVQIMGGKNIGINISKKTSIILICGLQGSGKTSFSSKLAFFLKKKGNNPILVSADVYRPAAIDQLNALAKKINIPVFSLKDNNNVLDIINQSISYATTNNKNIIIIDTAGRLGVDRFMMDEIKNIHNTFHPSETLLVVDSMTGQDGVNTAKIFSKTLNINGCVITKLDGDSKGGVALTISSIIKKPIKFISIGEKIEDIEIFYPDRMANRIIGMGDVVTLVEKVQEQFDEKSTKKIYKKISDNQFNFYDFLDQIKRIRKIGNIKNIISMIPGIGNKFFLDDKIVSFKRIESIILSMTPYERNNPNIFSSASGISRKKRISKGSGISLKEIDIFLKNFNGMNKIMKNINPTSGNNMIKDFLSKIMDKKDMF
ncbi:signal recognition particle protein [Blattabacterium cuenoti]|uniref:signal recognition particle protein n=1 Tax=Blattabacterium cuenoti TaxID=1653831 RepID=UPI00163C9907|nr:signal recognition particle protein [Blattabacterium cuenoti]